MRPIWSGLLGVVGLAALMLVVSATAPRWSRLFRQPLPSAAGDEAEPPEQAPAPAPAPTPSASAEARRRINVKLFFEANDRTGLVIEDREVAFVSDLAGQVRVVLDELIAGSHSGLALPLNGRTKVLGVFATARGVAYVDLSREVLDSTVDAAGGSLPERLAVWSVVNTVTTNFPALSRVQIVVDDRPADTLAGHVDLSRPLAADLTLLAPAPLQAVESPSPSPAATERTP